MGASQLLVFGSKMRALGPKNWALHTAVLGALGPSVNWHIHSQLSHPLDQAGTNAAPIGSDASAAQVAAEAEHPTTAHESSEQQGGSKGAGWGRFRNSWLG